MLGPRRLLALIAMAALPGAPTWAGGSLGTDELAPLLRQRPQEIAAIRKDHRLSDSAFAQVRFGSHFKHLGGARMGPYEVQLYPRASGEARERVLWICTQARFLDRGGREIAQIDDAILHAVRVKETVTSVQVLDKGAPRTCPGSSEAQGPTG